MIRSPLERLSSVVSPFCHWIWNFRGGEAEERRRGPFGGSGRSLLVVSQVHRWGLYQVTGTVS